MPGDLNLPALTLPDYARSDLAFTDVLFVSALAANTRMVFVVPGAYIYYVVSSFVDIVTDATVGNRVLVWIVLDPDGKVVTQSPAATMQPASVDYHYQWALNPGAAYGPLLGHVLSPILPQVLTAGYTAGVQFNGKAAGDVGNGSFVVVKIPTGPPAFGGAQSALGSPLELGA